PAARADRRVDPLLRLVRHDPQALRQGTAIDFAHGAGEREARRDHRDALVRARSVDAESLLVRLEAEPPRVDDQHLLAESVSGKFDVAVLVRGAARLRGPVPLPARTLRPALEPDAGHRDR